MVSNISRAERAYGDRCVEVDEVLDRWLAPDHRYFKVRTGEGIYILRNDTASGAWELTSFARRAAFPWALARCSPAFRRRQGGASCAVWISNT
jgi:hypothetical protein